MSRDCGLSGMGVPQGGSAVEARRGGPGTKSGHSKNMHKALLKSLAKLQDAHGPGGRERMKRDSGCLTEPR